MKSVLGRKPPGEAIMQARSIVSENIFAEILYSSLF